MMLTELLHLVESANTPMTCGQLADRDYGERDGRIVDPFGHMWLVGCPLSSST